MGIVNTYTQIRQGKMTTIKYPSEIREIYDMLLEDEIEEKDRLDGILFRKDSVFIIDGDTHVHQGDPSEEKITQNLEKLIFFMNDSNIPILIKAIMTHYFFEYIHPFYDGNGRMGRFLFSAYISRKLDILSGLSLSSAIINNKTSYEEAFLEASHPKNKGELTFFVMSLIKIILTSQQAMIEKLTMVAQKLNNIDNHLRSKQYKKLESEILSLMFHNKMFDLRGTDLSNIKISEELKVSRYLVNKTMKDLEKSGTIQTLSKNPLVYRLSNQLMNLID